MSESVSPQELEVLGYTQTYDYTQYSHDNHVNVIPEESFKHLVTDTFRTMTDVLKSTYGPYGSSILISDQAETTTTKDGFNITESMGFNHHYKRMVYLTIKKICERVNRNVGDGTTSCMLLADKLFAAVNSLIKTPDDKRNILSILTSIEENLQNVSIIDEHKKSGNILPLTEVSLRNIIHLAGNYDYELTSTLYSALSPVVDENGIVTTVRNVIANAEIDYESIDKPMYSVDYLPGQYRVRIDIDTDLGSCFSIKQPIKIILYDHPFNKSDWDSLMLSYDNETPVLIVAKAITATMLNGDYTKYLQQKMFTKKPVTIFLTEIKGTYIQDELKDLAAILKTDVRTVFSGEVDHSKVPTATIQVYKGNALCFYDIEPPKEYIAEIEKKMKETSSSSYIKRREYLDRIRALKMETPDTLLTLSAPTSLEVKLLSDKIDDCVSIVKSAIDNGVVPNMLVYAYNRINVIKSKIAEAEIDETENADEANRDKELCCNVCLAMESAIKGLFQDIWESKFGPTNNEDYNMTAKLLYDTVFFTDEKQKMSSYDIIHEHYTSIEELPTSSQYDMEVVVAAISIVKYLLVSRALIFDAFLMKPQGDQGRFTRAD